MVMALMQLVAAFFVFRLPLWIFWMATLSQVIPSMSRNVLMVKSVLVLLSSINTVVTPSLYSHLAMTQNRISTSRISCPRSSIPDTVETRIEPLRTMRPIGGPETG